MELEDLNIIVNDPPQKKKRDIMSERDKKANLDLVILIRIRAIVSVIDTLGSWKDNDDFHSFNSNEREDSKQEYLSRKMRS